MHLNGKVYDALKPVAQIWLPALGTLYFTLAGIWNLPAAEQVVGTVVAVDTALGVILGISSLSYSKSDAQFDGMMALEPHPDGGSQVRMTSLDTDALLTKDAIKLKVVQPSVPLPSAPTQS